MTTAELLEHLTRPLGDGGHGFETGIPITSTDRADEFHETDHARNPGTLTHPHEEGP